MPTKDTVKVNGNSAKLIEVAADKKQAVVVYTFNVGKAQSALVAKDASKATYSTISASDYEWEVLRLCNIERAKEGLNALSMNGTLQNVCDIRVKEIKTLFSHDRPNGEDCYSAVPSSYELKTMGENIARGQKTPEKVVEDWMNSPGHRANILNPEYSYMGVGHSFDGNCWVQFFSNSKDITSVTSNASRSELSEEEIKDVYFTITASNGYVSYLPADFASMKKVGDKYYPRLAAKTLP